MDLDAVFDPIGLSYQTLSGADGNVTGYTYDTTWTVANGASSSVDCDDANWSVISSSHTDASGYSAVSDYRVYICFDGNNTCDIIWIFDNIEDGLDRDALSVFDPFSEIYNASVDDDLSFPRIADVELQSDSENWL